MKTNFEKIDNRWVVKTGYIVVVDYVRISANDYDAILADEVMDVCTGETFGLKWNHLVKSYGEVDSYKLNNRKANKKSRRRKRINNFIGIRWNQHTGFKRIGKNRKYSRRMHPNEDQVSEFGVFLPF